MKSRLVLELEQRTSQRETFAQKLNVVWTCYNTKYKGRRLITKKEALKILNGADNE